MAKNVDEDTEVLDRWVKHLMWQNGEGIPGVAICIRDAEGNVVFNKAYGVSDRDTQAPLQTDMIFPVASQSKTFTAAAVLLLADRGLLNLDDKITDYLPQFKDPRLNNVTLRDALSHNTTFHPGFWPQDIDTKWPKPCEIRDMNIEDAKFGKTTGYSNSMYSLLGLVVEDVSGMPFTKFAQKELLEKNGIKGVYASYSDVPPEQRGRIPKGYCDYPGAKHKEGINSDSEGGNPACGFFATPEGVSQFFQKLFTGGILKPETVEREMATRIKGAHGLGTSLVDTDSRMIKTENGEIPNPMFIGQGLGDLMGHAGDENGYSSETRFNPKTGYTVTVSRNRGDEVEDYAWVQKLNDRIGVKKILTAALKAFAPEEYGRSVRQLPGQEKGLVAKDGPAADAPNLRA